TPGSDQDIQTPKISEIHHSIDIRHRELRREPQDLILSRRCGLIPCAAWFLTKLWLLFGWGKRISTAHSRGFARIRFGNSSIRSVLLPRREIPLIGRQSGMT